MKGTIDELKFWNRSLTNDQIKAIFQNKTDIIVSNMTTTGENWTFDVTPNDNTSDGATARSNQLIVTDQLVPLDSTAPEVEWITENNQNYSIMFFNQTFNVSVFEENNDSVIFVFDNATGNRFNISAFNGSGHWARSVNVSGLEEGRHIVTAYVNDTKGNVNNTENLSFTVDFTSPTAEWITPTNVSNYTLSTGNVSFNITINDLTPYAVLFSFNNNTGNVFNVTAINDSGEWYANVNVSGLVEGTTVVTVIANDSVGNINNTEQLTIVVDNTAPTVEWFSPENNTNYSLSYGNVSFNVTVNELNFVHNISFSFDNASGNAFNVSGINDSGTWYANVNVSGLTEGLNTITVFANDSVGNVNDSIQVSLTADFTSPTVTWVLPNNNSNYTLSTGNVSFNITINDLTPYAVLFSFNNNTGNVFNVTAINDSGEWYANVNVSGLVEGTTVVTVIANDSVGNINNTEQLTIVVDNTAPTVVWTNPNNNTNYSLSYGNVSFNITVNELNFVHNLSFSFDNASGNAFNVSGINDSGTWYANVNVSGLTEGLNSITIFANDSAGNINFSEKIYLTPDFTAPVVNHINTNVSNYTTTSGNITFNVSVKDVTPYAVIFMFDNGTGTGFNRTPGNFSGHWNITLDVTSLEEGVHIMKVHSNDSVGNVNNTQQITFTVDNTAPTVVWTNPANQTNYSLSYGNVSFNVTVNELNFVHNLSFSFDNASGNAFNVSGINDSGTWYTNVNVSGLTEGLNTVTVFANDSSGNVNASEQISFIADFTSPVVNITFPINGSIFNLSSGNFTFNVTIKDLTPQSVLLSFDNGTGNVFNVTTENNSGYWLASVNVSGLENGTHFVTVLANDSLGQTNNSINVTIIMNNITNPVEASSSSSSSSSSGSSSSDSSGGGSLPPKKEEKKDIVEKEPDKEEDKEKEEKETDDKAKEATTPTKQKPQGFVGFAILPDDVGDLINYGSLAGIVALIISLISAVPVIARKRRAGVPQWFEEVLEEHVDDAKEMLIQQDFTLIPRISRFRHVPRRDKLAWLGSWVNTMINSGFSESKIIKVAKHHPKITEAQVETVLERAKVSKTLQQQYGLDDVGIKELQQYVLSKSKKPEIVLDLLIAAGWNKEAIGPFVNAYTNKGKGKKIHKVYAISYAVALKRLKISYDLSEKALNKLKDFIENEQMKAKSIEQITSMLVNQGWLKKEIKPFVKAYMKVSPHRNS